LGIEAQSDDVPWVAIAQALSLRSASEVVLLGQELGLAISPMPDGEDEQLRDRGTTNPARPWIQRRVGTRQRDISLNGARVVDLSSLWAGPLCSRILTEAGAKVVKVESSTRPDASRDGDSAFFDWLHAGQEFASLPLEEPSGVADLVALLEQADVVIEGSRPRALDRLGIIPAEIVAKRPGTVWLSITAYGRCGPWRDWVGFGDDAAVAGGLVDLNASGVPSFVGDAVADPLTGLLAAAIVADAVGHGGGVTIDVALREVARSAAAAASVVW
jgi:crotonobetainyl-CoA:carnitine CoA-transferase CaiB-like acyl-CoA transferase